MREEQTEYGILHFHEHFVVGTIHAGIDFDKACVDDIVMRLNAAYGNRPFVYISNRIHDYSLNPAQVRRLESETSIIAAAFVLLRRFSHESFQTERVFYKLPIATFQTVDEAITWARAQIDGASSSEPEN